MVVIKLRRFGPVAALNNRFIGSARVKLARSAVADGEMLNETTETYIHGNMSGPNSNIGVEKASHCLTNKRKDEQPLWIRIRVVYDRPGAGPCYVDADVTLAIVTGSVVGVPKIGPDACFGLVFGGAMRQRLGLQTPFRSLRVRFPSGFLGTCDSPPGHLGLRNPPFLFGTDPV